MNKLIILGILTMLLLPTVTAASSIKIDTIQTNSPLLTKSNGPVDKWALIIGTGKRIQSENDAEDMTEVLRDNGWSRDHIKTLTLFDTTKEDIFKGIEWLESKEDGNDIVFFFFSGHGDRGCIFSVIIEEIKANELENGYTSFMGEKYIGFSEFETDKLILIFDSCRSGSLDIDASYQPKKSPSLLINDDPEYEGNFGSLAKPGRVILAASKKNELAYAESFDLRNGVFTYFLVEGLGGEAKSSNLDKYITIREAFNYAAGKTTEYVDEVVLLGQQHPQMYYGCNEEIKITEIENFKQTSILNLIRSLIYSKIMSLI